MYSFSLMSRTGSPLDFDQFDDWESIEMDDDIYAGTESDLYEEWEDDGAIAQVRESYYSGSNDLTVENIAENESELDESGAQVLSLLDRTNSKKSALQGIEGPSEDELSKIEDIGIDEYIDAVLGEEEGESFEIHSRDDVILETDEVDEQDDETFSEAASEEDVIFSDEILPKSVPAKTVLSDLTVQPIFQGVACSIPTFFDEDGDVEYKITARFAKRLSENGVSSIFVATKDGEGETLSRKERKNLISSVAKLVESNIVVDVTAPSTKQSVQLVKDSIDAGASAFVIEISSQTKDPYVLCEAIHNAAADMPLFLCLKGAAQDLPLTPDFLYDLPVSGVIDSTGDAAFFIDLMRVYSGPIYIGSIPMLAMARSENVVGAVLSITAIDQNLVLNAYEGNLDSIQELASLESDFGGITAQRVKQSLESELLISPTVRD